MVCDWSHNEVNAKSNPAVFFAFFRLFTVRFKLCVNFIIWVFRIAAAPYMCFLTLLHKKKKRHFGKIIPFVFYCSFLVMMCNVTRLSSVGSMPFDPGGLDIVASTRFLLLSVSPARQQLTSFILRYVSWPIKISCVKTVRSLILCLSVNTF